jgi:osmotically-inducible protein OsmY
MKKDVQNALKQSGFRNIDVDEDRDKGVITLCGKVDTWKQKRQAEEVARENSGNSVVANELIVTRNDAEQAEEAAENNDQRIEAEFRDWLKQKKLDKQKIEAESTSGVLKLTGTVTSNTIKKKVADGAKEIQGVTQVVNELQVKAPRNNSDSGK